MSYTICVACFVRFLTAPSLSFLKIPTKEGRRLRRTGHVVRIQSVDRQPRPSMLLVKRGCELRSEGGSLVRSIMRPN